MYLLAVDLHDIQQDFGRLVHPLDGGAFADAVEVEAAGAEVGAGQTFPAQNSAVGAAAHGDFLRGQAGLLNGLAGVLDEVEVGLDLLDHVAVAVLDLDFHRALAVLAVQVARDVEQVVLAIVVTTGIASIFLTKDFTPDYNSGLAHAIFYALTSYPVIEEKHLHGEVVGFGVLFALLVDQQYEEFEKIYTLNQQLQLPTSLEQIEITEEQWEESMDRIPEMSDIRHYPYKVTKEMLALAMNQLKEREGGRLINA